VSLRALVLVWLKDRRVATLVSLAVVCAFGAGVTSPFVVQPFGTVLAGAAAPPTPSPTTAPTVASAVPRGNVAARCRAGARPATARGRGNVDAAAVGDGPARGPVLALAVPPNTALHLAGWAALAHGPAAFACVVADGVVTETDGEYGSSRPDVAAALHDPALSNTGLSLVVRLKPGHHRVAVAGGAQDGSLTTVLPAFSVDVR